MASSQVRIGDYFSALEIGCPDWILKDEDATSAFGFELTTKLSVALRRHRCFKSLVKKLLFTRFCGLKGILCAEVPTDMAQEAYLEIPLPGQPALDPQSWEDWLARHPASCCHAQRCHSRGCRARSLIDMGWLAVLHTGFLWKADFCAASLFTRVFAMAK